eukprot:m.368992 g.368992  ORF g.368992 m.368992 type:complete len:438 (+) comp56110_c0_seq6:3-1316(+)
MSDAGDASPRGSPTDALNATQFADAVSDEEAQQGETQTAEVQDADQSTLPTDQRDQSPLNSPEALPEDQAARSLALFGSDDEDDGNQDQTQDYDRYNEDQEQAAPLPKEELSTTFPIVSMPLADDMFSVVLPNFLSIEPSPFDPRTYVHDASQTRDDSGQLRVKLKAESAIRWRKIKDEQGNMVEESNTRIVRWSDDTLSLVLGDEVFDLEFSSSHDKPKSGTLQGSERQSHLYILQQEGLTGLQGQTVLQKSARILAASTAGVAQRLDQQQKINHLATVPRAKLHAVKPMSEAERKEQQRQEQERKRAETKQQQQLSRKFKSQRPQQSLSAKYLEDEDDEVPDSVAAVKSAYGKGSKSAPKKRGGRAKDEEEDEEDEEDDDEEDEDDGGFVVDDDEDESVAVKGNKIVDDSDDEEEKSEGKAKRRRKAAAFDDDEE